MVAELALDQWTVTYDNIERRVNRYEVKAMLKKQYKQGDDNVSTQTNLSNSLMHESHHDFNDEEFKDTDHLLSQDNRSSNVQIRIPNAMSRSNSSSTPRAISVSVNWSSRQ